jgi:sarcosine oxidase
MRKYHDQQVYDHIVIGIGGMGSSACYFLSLSGNSVLGLEANDIPNQLGSSHGYSRIIRLAYHEHPNYVPLLKRAYQIYEEIEEITKSKVMFVTGCVEAGPKGNSLVQGTIESSKLHRLEYEEMSGEQVNQRFRGFRIPDDYQAVYQPKGGFLDPELCISNFVKLACANGAEIRAREKVVKWEKCGDIIQVTSNKGVYYSRKLCICAGAWSSELIQELKEANALQIERQVLGWFMPKKNSTDDFKLGNFPVFIVDSGKCKLEKNSYAICI